MRPLLISLLLLLTAALPARQGKTGIFGFNEDIGNPAKAGSAIYNAADQSYSVRGGGYNIWFERDEFHYLYNKIKGDFILTANFEFAGQGKNNHRKTGWMVRATTEDKSPHITATLHGDGLTVLQWRGEKGAPMRDPQDELFADTSWYTIIQMERSGKNIIMRAAHPGQPFHTIGSHIMENLPDEVMAGLFVCSHDTGVLEEARIWNVRIDKPVPDNYNEEKSAGSGCRLETMNVFNGKRTIVYEKAGRFEAPNWMPDGKKLLFNMNGLLWTISTGGGDPEKFNTGSVKHNNNDHGISFDGKMLAISGHREGLPGGGSTVYVVPLPGGEPTMVTEHTPSYFHGWAPDNKHVVYVAQRKGIPVYNIYRNSIKGDEEVALTDNKTGEHVDGCEYSPDGKYIYYNGSHTGSMQLWRMKPDGTGREQLTNDEYNNWFPHISPDGKWIAFISFGNDVSPNDHPSYKRVMLRLMPATVGKPVTIAWLYGGQGTFNVPSWSPDSRQIAFVSNSGF